MSAIDALLRIYEGNVPEFRQMAINIKMAINPDAVLSENQEAQVLLTIAECVENGTENQLSVMVIAAYINTCK